MATAVPPHQHQPTQALQPQTSAPQTLEPKYRALVLLVSIGFFMQALDTTIVNTAIPAIAKSLNEDPLQLHWVVVAYVLAVACCIPLSGWFADRFGVQRTYFAAIVIFTAASMGCASASSLNELIAYRVLQGVGGALLLPVGRLAMLKLIPRAQFLAAMSLMSLAGLLGPLFGPALGGWLITIASWHWIFFINVPMGLLGAILTLKLMPNAREAEVKAFDRKGFVLLLMAMLGWCLGLEQLGTAQHDAEWLWLSLATGVLATLGYVIHALHEPNALFRSRLFKHRLYVIGILGNFFARLGGNAVPFVLPLLLQVAFGFSALYTGLMMIPVVLGSLFSKPLIRPIIARVGYRNMLICNTVLVGLCIASFALTQADTPLWLRALHFFVFGVLNSLQFVAMNTLTLKDLPQQDASSGNSFLSMLMMLSMSLGVAIAASLVQLFSVRFTTGDMTAAFHASLLCLGAINILSAWIFSWIPRQQRLN